VARRRAWRCRRALAGDAAAELAFSRDGRFVYAGLRGSNTIAVVEVRGDGAQLRPVALVDAGVEGPRHHVVVRDTLLVAGQHSDEIAALTLNERTGVPGRARRRVDAPRRPVCSRHPEAWGSDGEQFAAGVRSVP
jgi:6-phosphogluconolactonase (cycloisomerase 2 family)